MNAYFDADAFLDAVNTIRLGRGATWKQVSEESGVPLGTITYFTMRIHKPNIDTFALLVTWSGLDANAFIVRPVEREAVS